MHRAWLLGLLAVSSLAHAAPGDEDAATCRNGLFANSPAGFALAKVAVPRLYLLDDSDGCPGRGEVACRRRAYVVKGDVVVLAQRRGGFACAFYPNKVGGSAGWVAQESVQPLPSAAAPTPQAWNGRWHDGDNQLQLTANGDGSVTVNGDAYWPSANPDPEQRPGGPNIGAVTARLSGRQPGRGQRGRVQGPPAPARRPAGGCGQPGVRRRQRHLQRRLSARGGSAALRPDSGRGFSQCRQSLLQGDHAPRWMLAESYGASRSRSATVVTQIEPDHFDRCPLETAEKLPVTPTCCPLPSEKGEMPFIQMPSAGVRAN